MGETIGGVFSGVFAFLGVFFTIKYYKNAEDKKEKSSIQPFLLITGGAIKNPISGFDLDNESRDNKTTVDITIKNIGNGFASILVLRNDYNIGGFAFNKVICANEEEYVFLRAKTESFETDVRFNIQYIDAIRNEYVQEYTVKKSNNHINVDCSYPEFLEQI